MLIKTLIISNITLILIVGTVMGTIIGMAYEEQQQELGGSSSQGQTSPSTGYVPRPSSNPSPASAPSPPPEPPLIPTATPEEYARLEQIIPQNEMIQKLPEDARIQMIFFNRNSGYWRAERYYKISKASVIPGTISNPEFKFVMNARWVSQFTESNFCEVMHQARAASEADAEAFGSKTSLLWKYRGVIGYRDCLGF
jgi:hypothetical protein